MISYRHTIHKGALNDNNSRLFVYSTLSNDETNHADFHKDNKPVLFTIEDKVEWNLYALGGATLRRATVVITNAEGIRSGAMLTQIKGSPDTLVEIFVQPYQSTEVSMPATWIGDPFLQ